MNVKIFAHRFAVACGAALVLFAGCQKKEETPPPAPAPAPAAAKPAVVSAVKNSFDEVTAKLDKGGNFYLYLSTEQVLTNLNNYLAAGSNFVATLPNIPGTGVQTVDKVFTVLDFLLKHSGVSEISGLGMSSIARETNLFYNKVVVHHYPGQNEGLIWSAFGKASHPLKELDLLPESTALASSFDFDLPLVWTNIQEAVQTLNESEVSGAFDQAPVKFKQFTGLDLGATLDSLGGEYGLILTLDPHKIITIPLPGGKSLNLPDPGLCLVFKVNSNLIFDRVDQVLKGNPLVTKVEEPDLKMRTMTIPLPIPLEVRPSVARVGDYLLLASSDNVVRDIVAVKSGQKKGFKTTDEFKRLSQGIPAEGNSFSLMSAGFLDTIDQVKTETMAGQNVNTNALKRFDELFQKSAAYSVGANGPEGWLGVGNGPNQSAAMLILPAVATAGILSAIAIPNFVKARNQAQHNMCINNLRQIEVAKKQWALDNNKQNTDTPAKQDLLKYLGDKMPVCPAGGDYTIGSVGEKPTCSHPGHDLPE
jgi:hypothetical protein